MKYLEYLAAAVAGILAGAVVGVLAGTIETMLMSYASSVRFGALGMQIILDVAVVFVAYRIVRADKLSVTSRVFFIAMCAGVLGMLAVCSIGILSSNTTF